MAPSRPRGPRFRVHRAAIQADRWIPRRLHWWLARRVFADVAAGTCVLLFDDALRVLLVSSTYSPGWSTPGGFVGRGESAAAAARRELGEELGVDPLIVEVAGSLRGDLPVVDVVFCGRLPSGGELRPDHVEIRSCQWFALDGELPDWDPEVPAALATLRRSLGADGLREVLSAGEQDRLRQLLAP